MSEISDAISEIQQSRSRFQLESFVVNQHDTPEMRFFQICIELQSMEYKMAVASLQLKKDEIKIARLRETGDELDEIKAQERELGREQTQVVMLGAEREIDILREMFHASPKYTRPEIEQSQPEYWKARLGRQYALQSIAGGAGWAQLDAMRQAGMVELEAGQLTATGGVAELGEPTRL